MFKPGQKVKVKRTSGVMEDDWTVYRCPHPDDIAFMAPEVIANLAVYVGRMDLQKRVSMSDLLEWQKV